MKGGISSGGYLWIKRGKEERKYQVCPFISNSEEEVWCGDWCPHFGEPEFHEMTNLFTGEITKEWTLRICQNRVLTFKEFIDEREKEKEE